MANNPSSSQLSLFLLPILLLLLFILLLPATTSSQSTRANICNITRFPSLCNAILPGGVADFRDSGRYSLRKSLDRSHSFLNHVESYLGKNAGLLSRPVIGALGDCRELVTLNLDLLSISARTVGATNAFLPALGAEDLMTALSTVMTNLDTCAEGLGAHPTVHDEMSRGGLYDDVRLHSVSLALCAQGWVPPVLRGISAFLRSLFPGTPHMKLSFKGPFPLRFLSDEKRRAFDSAYNRPRQGGGIGTRLISGQGLVLVNDIAVVSNEGFGDYTSINDAVAAAPNNSVASDGYFLIYVTAGVYEEYVNIGSNKRYVFVLGDGINQTIITGNRSVGDNFTTFNSATFVTTGQGFLGVDFTVRNMAGPSKGQAVALRSSADESAFYRCSFEAYQDTLYTHSNRQFYRDCDVYGTVDFIFGNAAVVLQNCNIYPRLPNKGQFNAITAQGRTDPNMNTGTSIHNCAVLAADDLAASNGTTRTYLGRPWKDYSRTVVMQSFLDSLIYPAGWHEWNGNASLSTLYYAEYDNWGPGSDTTGRVDWPGFHVLTDASEAEGFTVAPFLAGNSWLPRTGVPYEEGLI